MNETRGGGSMPKLITPCASNIDSNAAPGMDQRMASWKGESSGIIRRRFRSTAHPRLGQIHEGLIQMPLRFREADDVRAGAEGGLEDEVGREFFAVEDERVARLVREWWADLLHAGQCGEGARDFGMGGAQSEMILRAASVAAADEVAHRAAVFH